MLVGAKCWVLYVMNHRYWIVLFMVGIPALFLFVVVLFIYWRDERRLRLRGRTRAIRKKRKSR